MYVLVRSFAKTPEQLSEVVERAVETARYLKPVDLIDRICFLVPTDHDFGGTAEALRDILPGDVMVLTAPGYHSGEALSKGLEAIYSVGASHALVLSGKATSYINNGVVTRAADAFALSAKVVGVNLIELEEVHVMPIENTACFWDLEALRRVGWFDSKIGVEEVSAIARISQKHAKKCVTLIPGASGYLNIAKSREGRHKEVVDT